MAHQLSAQDKRRASDHSTMISRSQRDSRERDDERRRQRDYRLTRFEEESRKLSTLTIETTSRRRRAPRRRSSNTFAFSGHH